MLLISFTDDLAPRTASDLIGLAQTLSTDLNRTGTLHEPPNEVQYAGFGKFQTPLLITKVTMVIHMFYVHQNSVLTLYFT